MVYLMVDNLLSSSKNRVLMEALWFLAISRNGKPEKFNKDFENYSIASICTELRAQINNEDTDARKFCFSAQLVFGTLQLYKIQIDKLYDQSRLILQTWNKSVFNQDWLVEMSQSQKQSKQKPKKIKNETVSVKTKSSANKKKEKSNKENVISDNIIEDFELMENIFKIPVAKDDDDEEETLNYLTSTNKKVKKENNRKCQVLNDITVVNHVKNITLLESHIASSSGYQTYLNFNDDEDFGETSGFEFKNMLKGDKETETKMYMCRPMDDSANGCSLTENNETSFSKGCVNSSMNENCAIDEIFTTLHYSKASCIDKAKPRRLTYDNINEHMPRSNNNQQKLMDENLLDVYDMSSRKEFSTFDEQSNVMEISKMTNLPIDPEKEIQHEILCPEIPIDVTNVELPQPEVEEELVLEQLDKSNIKRKNAHRKRMLIVDKQTMLSNSVIHKNNESYREKSTEHSPFQSFEIDLFYSKNCAETLFDLTSLRMKNSSSKLIQIYRRNMSKIPERLLKRQVTIDKEADYDEEPSPPKRARVLRSQNSLSGRVKNQFEKEIPVEEILNESLPLISTPPAPNLQPMEMQAMFDMEIELPPIPNYSSPNENDYSPPEKKLKIRTNAKQQQLNSPSPEETGIEGSEQDKQVILSKLKKLWSKPKEPITMSRLCIGQNRFEAAKTFFELLVLSKTGAVELIQNEFSLEIVNICRKI